MSSGDQSSGRETTLVDNEVYNLITTISSKLEDRRLSEVRAGRPGQRSDLAGTAAAGRAGGAAADAAAGAIRSARQAPSPLRVRRRQVIRRIQHRDRGSTIQHRR